MCYAVYISTDGPEDLAARNSELVQFSRLPDAAKDPCTSLLDFPNQWYVGSKSKCSCTFRHLCSVELGFGVPEGWAPEEQDNVAATKELFAALTALLSSEHHVDLIDRWEGARPADITTLEVSLDKVSEAAFRMFENHKFTFKKRETQAAR